MHLLRSVPHPSVLESKSPQLESKDTIDDGRLQFTFKNNWILVCLTTLSLALLAANVYLVGSLIMTPASMIMDRFSRLF